jgi:CheY-like chemotaxis protein
MIVFLTSDLMMSSNASSHARQKKIELKTVDSTIAAIGLIELQRPHLFLIDLQTPGLEVEALGESVRELADSVCPLTIAYAQHVNVDLIQRAKTAGFDQVLTRGQFNSQIGQIVDEAN